MNKKILYFLLLVFSSLSCDVIYAEDRNIEINVTGNFRPIGSQGFIFSKQGIITKPVIKVENLADNVMLVSIPYTPSEIEEGVMASAVLFGPNGETAFGDVKLINNSASIKSFYNIPECSNEIPVPEGLNTQVGLLESLVAIRVARREGHQLRLKQILSGAFLEKLRRLEKGFGLNYPVPLSNDLNAFELVDRLSRLSNAIRNYQSNKN